MSSIDRAQQQGQAAMNKAQQKGSELYNRMPQEGKDAVNRGQAALREIRDNTLISTIVRYSLLVESTMLTLFGLVHFFMPAYAAQFTFPSNVTYVQISTKQHVYNTINS